MSLRKRKKNKITSKQLWISEIPSCCHFSTKTREDLLEKILPENSLIVPRYNHCFLVTSIDYSSIILSFTFRRPLFIKKIGKFDIMYNDKEVRGRIYPLPKIGHYSNNEYNSIETMKGYWESLNRVLKEYVDKL